MRALCINYIRQHRFFSEAFLNSRDDQFLLNLYVSTLSEVRENRQS